MPIAITDYHLMDVTTMCSSAMHGQFRAPDKADIRVFFRAALPRKREIKKTKRKGTELC